MNENLLTKKQSAEFLGLSVSTFDRVRDRVNLEPVPSLREKPIFFRRSDLELLASAFPPTNFPPPPAVEVRDMPSLGAARIISVKEAKARARKGGKA